MKWFCLSVSEIKIIDDTEMLHDVKLGNHFNTTWSSGTHLEFHIVGGQVAVTDSLTLLHRSFIQLLVIVSFGDVFRLRLTFEIQKWCVIVRNALIVLHIAKDVE